MRPAHHSGERICKQEQNATFRFGNSDLYTDILCQYSSAARQQNFTPVV